MSVAIREQLREIGEFQRSNRRPIELSEVETRTESGRLVAPRRRLSGPITAVVAMALVLIVGGGLALLFNTAQENPPADSVTPTTQVVPTTTPGESSELTQIVTSDGPLNVTVEWRKLNETASRSGFEMDLPLFPGYEIFVSGMLWKVDGEWVLPLQPSGLANESAERNNYAFSSDGYSWEIRPVLPGSPVATEDLVLGFLLPDIRDGHPVLNQFHQSWNMSINLPDDPGSPPEFVHHAYHDGDQWHEVSFDAGFLVEAAGDQPVTLSSDLSCAASDTIAWYELRAETVEDGPVPPVIVDGFLLINGDQATQLPDPPGARRFPDGSLNPWGLVCWEDGTYSVSETTVYHLQDGDWLPVASLPSDEIDSSQGWSPDSGYYMARSENDLWVTQDFESWETYLLPESVVATLAYQATMAIHRRDGLWMVGSTRWGSSPEGLWISEDLETWELIPPPRLNSGNLRISLPAEGLLVATDGDQLTRNVWVGRLTR